MSLKVTTDQYGTVIYRKDKTSNNGNPYTTYSTRVSSKNADGNYVSAFIDVNFKKGVSVDNKAKISIKNAFYTVSEYNDKTYMKLMVTDFDVLEPGETNSPMVDADGFINIGLDDDLPLIFD